MKTRPRATPADPRVADLADRLNPLCSVTRLEILAALLAHGPATIAEVGLRVGVLRCSAEYAVNELAAAGLVTLDPPRGRFRIVTATPAAAIRALEEAFDLLSGSAPAAAEAPASREEVAA